MQSVMVLVLVLPWLPPPLITPQSPPSPCTLAPRAPPDAPHLPLPWPQWWRDAVNDCFKGRAPPQPVMTALGEVLSAGHALTRYRLQQVVSSREDDLMSHAQPASLAALDSLQP